jgi:hypothetical protein
MESEFLQPAANLEQVIGTLLFAINAEVESDDSRAELSLAAWQQWLDEEGYPIDEAIEQFCKHVSKFHQAELHTIKSELTARLHDPSGLSVLSDIVDAQQPEIAENLHEFMERALVKAHETYGIAGGTKARALEYGGGALALTTIVVATAIGVNKRNKRLQLEALELDKAAKGAFETTKANMVSKLEEDRRLAANGGSRAVERRVVRNQAEVEVLLRRGDPRIKDHSNITIDLNKDARKFTKSEVRRHVKSYSESLAKDSMEYLERNDAARFKDFYGYFKAHFKTELISQDGRKVVTFLDENGVERYGVTKGFSMLPIAEYGQELKDFTEVDVQAERMAKAKMESIFFSNFETITQDSFKLAKKSANAEVKRIDLSFARAYDESMQALGDEYNALKAEEGKEFRKIRKAIEAEARTAEREGDDLLIEIEQDGGRALRDV